MKIALVLLVSTSFVNAASFPQEIPLSPERQEYLAKNLINHGTVGVQGSTVSGTWIVSKPYTGPKGDLKAVSAAFKAVQLDYSVDPTEKVSSFANYEYRSPDGSQVFSLFWGQKDWNYVKDAGGNWIAPSDKLVIDNMSFNQLPVEIMGIAEAYVVYRDASGNQVGYYNFNDGGFIRGNYLILGPYRLQGTTGELYVRRNDGSLAVYSLTGSLRFSVSMKHGIDSSIPSIREVPTNTVEIVYQPTDSVVLAKYTVDAVVTVRLSAAGAAAPTNIKNVAVSEKKALDANPLAGEKLDPTKPMTFKVKAGEEWVVIFEKSQKG